MPQLLIDQELVQRIADYLVERPYREVAVLLNQMASIQPAPATPDPSGALESDG